VKGNNPDAHDGALSTSLHRPLRGKRQPEFFLDHVNLEYLERLRLL